MQRNFGKYFNFQIKKSSIMKNFSFFKFAKSEKCIEKYIENENFLLGRPCFKEVHDYLYDTILSQVIVLLPVLPHFYFLKFCS